MQEGFKVQTEQGRGKLLSYSESRNTWFIEVEGTDGKNSIVELEPTAFKALENTEEKVHHEDTSIRILTAIRERKPQSSSKGKLRVYCDMVADLFHYGHVEFLKNAKEQALKEPNVNSLDDVWLMVGIHSNETVMSYKRCPIMNMSERMVSVASCFYVDQVIPFAPLGINQEWMDKHQIDLVCGNACITGDPVYDSQYNVPREANKYRIIPYTDGISTTDIIRRVLLRSANAMQREFGENIKIVNSKLLQKQQLVDAEESKTTAS